MHSHTCRRTHTWNRGVCARNNDPLGPRS